MVRRNLYLFFVILLTAAGCALLPTMDELTESVIKSMPPPPAEGIGSGEFWGTWGGAVVVHELARMFRKMREGKAGS
jgi:hypothetical protein